MAGEIEQTQGGTFEGGTTTTISPGFGSWTTLDADEDGFLIVQILAETDGTSKGQVIVLVDESGGTTQQYVALKIIADDSAGSGFRMWNGAAIYIPAGGTFKISNVSDPNTNNNIELARKVT